MGYFYDWCPSGHQYDDSEIKEYTDGDIRNLCDYFKDYSNFIELPCHIGETVYMISYGHDDWSGHDFKMIIQASFRLDMLKDFNKRFFLTREEAEKKLEEMNANE
jgi:hypothetical protein